MTNLFFHNLMSGWRNILKYKVQNTVSILCLSVGVICFGVTLYFTNAWWHDTMKYEFDSKYIKNWGNNSDLDGIAPTTIAFADSLQQLPSVKSVLFKQSIISTDFTFRGKNGKEEIIYEQLSYISPDWLKENNFYSTVTGKKIDTLKPGTVVVSKRFGELLMNLEIDPIGTRIINSYGYGPISDVVISDTNMDSFGGICVVVEGAKNLHTSNMDDILNTSIYSIAVRLNDDADFEKFAKERKTIRPYEEIWEGGFGKPFLPVVLWGLTLLIFLGAGVLIIGLSGYLKMQLQLFTLRSREMALRRCNGAHPRHIFWLYVSEILIVAAITAVVTAIIAYAFQGFMMPKLNLFSFSSIMYINLNAIYRIIAEVLIATFVLAIVLSWFSLRKVISKPLSETVGRSYAHKSAFTKTMQVAQYFAATIFLFAALVVTYDLRNSSDEKRLGLKNGVDDFKSITMIGQPALPEGFRDRVPDFEKEYRTLPSADKVAKYFTAGFTLKQGEYNDERIIVEYVNVTDSTDYYNGFYANPEIFSIYGREIVEKKVCTDHPYDAEATPVFAFPDEAKQMAKTLGVTHKISDEIVPLPDGLQCILLGYARTLPQEIILKNRDSYYVVASDSMFSKYFDESVNRTEFLIKPKDGKTKQLQEELATAWDRHFPEYAGAYHGMTAYDRWCKEYEMYNVIGQLCFLLVAVSILCIILTVYSSVSLETRGRQKEIAIRKVNGAKTKDIIRLLSRHYVRTLAIAFVLAFIFGIILIVAISGTEGDWPNLEIWLYCIAFYLASIIIVTLITALTVGQKIYKVAKTNAAEYLIN